MEEKWGSEYEGKSENGGKSKNEGKSENRGKSKIEEKTKMEEEIHVQVTDNSPSIEHILRPISYISWLMGVGVARPRKFPKVITIIVRVLHLIVCSIHVTKAIAIINYKTTPTSNDIYTFMFYTNLVICYVSSYYYVCHGISQYDKWPELMDTMSKLDQKIRREISINDQPIERVEALAFIAGFICCLPFVIVHVFHCHLKYPECITSFDLLFYYILAQSLINSSVFDIIVYVLYSRFQMINKLLGQLDESFDTSWITLKIRCIRELHNGTRLLVIMVNDIHGFHLLLCSANCFTMVLTTLLRVYIGLVKGESVFMIIHANILWVLYVAQFGLMCWICTLAREESQRTGTFIYAFVLKCKNLYLNCVRNEVNDFAIQLQHRVAFTACNFFEIHNVLFTGFIAVIMAHLIIVIQFYTPPEESLDYWGALSGIL